MRDMQVQEAMPGRTGLNQFGAFNFRKESRKTSSWDGETSWPLFSLCQSRNQLASTCLETVFKHNTRMKPLPFAQSRLTTFDRHHVILQNKRMRVLEGKLHSRCNWVCPNGVPWVFPNPEKRTRTTKAVQLCTNPGVKDPRSPMLALDRALAAPSWRKQKTANYGARQRPVARS